jgi:uncharacterized protein
MFSLQALFGKGAQFFDLLEQSAEAAHASVQALTKLLDDKTREPALNEFMAARSREKELAAKISQELVDTFVTALEREDIEAISQALYKIPKAMEKFAERWVIVRERLAGIDFRPRTQLLDQAAVIVVELIKGLRQKIGLEPAKKMVDRLRAIESEADRLLMDLYRDLARDQGDAIRALLMKDMYDLLEKAIDRCRDVGNIVYHVVLKSN